MHPLEETDQKEKYVFFAFISPANMYVSVYTHVFPVQSTAFFPIAHGINAKKHQNGTIQTLSFCVEFHSTIQFLGKCTAGFKCLAMLPT